MIKVGSILKSMSGTYFFKVESDDIEVVERIREEVVMTTELLENIKKELKT